MEAVEWNDPESWTLDDSINIQEPVLKALQAFAKANSPTSERAKASSGDDEDSEEEDEGEGDDDDLIYIDPDKGNKVDRAKTFLVKQLVPLTMAISLKILATLDPFPNLKEVEIPTWIHLVACGPHQEEGSNSDSPPILTPGDNIAPGMVVELLGETYPSRLDLFRTLKGLAGWVDGLVLVGYPLGITGSLDFTLNAKLYPELDAYRRALCGLTADRTLHQIYNDFRLQSTGTGGNRRNAELVGGLQRFGIWGGKGQRIYQNFSFDTSAMTQGVEQILRTSITRSAPLEELYCELLGAWLYYPIVPDGRGG